jgi:GT2 family glycosyltransferase
MTAVAVVIPNWNSVEYLERCIDGLLTQTIDVELLVVDNGSSDSSLEFLRRRAVPHVALTTNTGFARAVNLGARRTAAPLVFVLNADCVLTPGCLDVLVDAMTSDAGLGGVQPRIVQADATEASPSVYSAGQCLTRYGVAFERAWGEPVDLTDASQSEVFGVSGAACLLRRELFTALGGYDERYFAFFEDVDLNARARLAGWRFACLPAAEAVHVGHASWAKLPAAARFNVELTVRNRLATAVKVLPPGGVLAAVGLTIRSVVGGLGRGTALAALKGALSASRWLPRLLRERMRLRRGSRQLLDPWLQRTAGRGPDPRHL